MSSYAKILVVEDEANIAAHLQDRLEQLGYLVPYVAHTGQDALNAAATERFDLALMDVRLKGHMDGIQTAAELRSRYRVPCVYMTAHADDHTIHRAKLTHPLGYLVKPVHPKDLRSTVETALFRHGLDQKIRASEAWFHATLRSAGEAVMALDADSRVLFLNRVAEELTGWDSAAAAGAPLSQVLELLDQGTRAPAATSILGLCDAMSPRDYVYIDRHAVERIVEIAVSPHSENGAVSGYVLVARDVTETRELEQHALRAARVDAVGRLAGGLAHDLNNQLTILTCYAEDLKPHVAPQALPDLQTLQEAIATAARLVGQLMGLSSEEAAEQELIDVNSRLLELRNLIEHALGTGIDLRVNASAAPCLVRFDTGQFQRVLINLATHVRSTLAGAGTVTFKVEPAAALTNKVRVSVVIESKSQHHSQPHSPHVGKSDLTAVHALVAKHGGTVLCGAPTDHENTIEILLPGATSETEDQSSLSMPPIEDAAPRTVLLAEDDSVIRALLQMHLEVAGYEVLLARNGHEARALADSHVGPIDVLVTDVVLTDVRGPEVAGHCRRQRPDLKVVYMSGLSENQLRQSAGIEPASRFVSKPFAPSDLLTLLKAMLRPDLPAV